MDKKQIDIQKSLKKIFIKTLILNFFILITLLVISLLYTDYFKQRLAEQLSDSFRTSLINSDNRQIMLDITRPVLKDFSGVVWTSQSGSNNFSMPENFSKTNILFSGVSKVNIFFDEDKRFKYGELRFYYDRLAYSYLALALWVVLFLFSLRLAAMEKNRLLKEYALLMESEINKSLADLSAQVAHDICSPLAALDAALKGIEVPPEQKELVNSATARIRGIAEDLLKKYKVGGLGKDEQKNTQATDLAEITESILMEKKAQYPEIEFVFEKPEKPLIARTEPKEFSRIISNLINNSVEAMESSKNFKKIEIILRGENDKAILSIKDNGKGIPSEILSKIGEKGFTYGKESGNGLGLWHAISNVEKWGGKLKIESKLKTGTEIIIELPLTSVPCHPTFVVLIDDDPLVRKNWDLSAKKKGISLKTFKKAEDFLNIANNFAKDTIIYIDSELENGIKGEEVAKKIYSLGFPEIYLETGHSKDSFKDIPHIKDIIGKEPPF